MTTQNVNLNELDIKFADYCLNDGFFYVLFKNGESVQCCLAVDNDEYGERPFKAAIIEEENGFDEGLCRDCNRWASHNDECEWGHINDFLIEQARKEGLDII